MSNWQTIETAPKDGTRILLAMANGEFPYDGEFPYEVSIGWYRPFSPYSLYDYPMWEFPGDYTATLDCATHWMPLPEHPLKRPE